MTHHMLWIGLGLLALGAPALWLGLRGRRIDREPRCPARRCRYALGAVIESRSASGGEAFPLTCPECGRGISGANRLRIGTRVKRPRLITLGALLLLAGAAACGSVGYERWQRTRPIQAMPLWMLLRMAERDSMAQRWPHQEELVRRARAGLLTGDAARRVIDRILDWQEDPSVDVEVAATAFSVLCEQMQASEAQIRRYWDNLYQFELVLPNEVEAGGPVPFEVLVRFRGSRDLNAPAPTDIAGNGAGRQDLFSSMMALYIDELRVGGRVIALADDQQRLLPDVNAPFAPGERRWTWRSHLDAWNVVAAPGRFNGPLDVELAVSWAVEMFHRPRTIAGEVEQSITESLDAVGLPSHGSAALRGRTRVVPSLPPIEGIDDPATRTRLAAFLERCVIRAVSPDERGKPFIMIQAPSENGWDDASDGLWVLGDIAIRRGEAVFEGIWNECRAEGRIRSSGVPTEHGLAAWEALSASPDGWEIVFTPRPERAATKVGRPPAFAGAPIVTPTTVRLLQHRSGGFQWREVERPPRSVPVDNP